MTPSTRRAIWFLGIPVLVAAVIAAAGVGLLALWRARSSPNMLTLPTGFPVPGEPPASARSQETPPVLASVSVPVEPLSLAWSADGRYLAAGTLGRGTGFQEGHLDSNVYVLDVARASVAATLQTTNWVESLAFSPDGKWLAVGCRDFATVEARAGRTDLTVFAVPKFIAVNTFKGRVPGYGFVDLAWSADGRSLYAIDGPLNHVEGSPQVRRWAAPAFTEDAQPVIRVEPKSAYDALAVSPDARTLAVAERVELGSKRLIRLFDPGDGAERLSFRTVDEDITWTRLGFTPDGRAVGVLDRYKLEWWDVTTGKPAEPGWDVLTGRPAKPSVARLAGQPAGLSGGYYAVSPDGGWRAWGEGRRRGLGDLGFDNRELEFGAFVFLTERATAKTRTWRVEKTAGHWPVLAFSPDGKTLACTAGEPVGGAIRILAVPK